MYKAYLTYLYMQGSLNFSWVYIRKNDLHNLLNGAKDSLSML